MAELTSEQIAQRCFDLGLLDQRQVEAIWGELGTRDVSPEALKNLLLRRELLTNFQLDRLLRGERGGYFYGQFKVLYLVGAGTFARVFRAVDKNTARVVAVKALRKRFADDPTTTEQFLREGEMGTKLRHPNIVPIFEVHQDRKQSFLVMDFVEGRSLREFVKVRGKLDAAEATRLTADIVAGLNYAYEKGITHRDLRMSNVLVTSLGKARLVDFGLAAMNVNLASDDAIENCPNPRTIDYAALERVTGVRKDDARSDVYFCGCLYYNMLTGEAPLPETRDRLVRMSANRFQEIRPITELEPNLHPAVVKIVNRAMELNPKKRFQNPGEMLAELKLAERRIGAAEGETELSAPGGTVTVDEPVQEGLGKTLMVIESNIEMQNALRDRLKKHGYRVLVLSEPARAFQRFEQAAEGQQKVCDAVILFTHELGERGVEWFNRFGQQPATRNLPMIVLVGEKQTALKNSLQLSPQRVALTMPLRLKELRQTLVGLLGIKLA